MGTYDMYPLHTGYLTKSPPESRVTGNFKRWMKRWFVLWEDKTLEYYEERGDAKPKKTIDLSRCEFLDTNLSDKRFENIFSIKIKSNSSRDRANGRTYYLAADSPYEMANWVDKICKLCEFKATENNNNTDTTIRHKASLSEEVVRSKDRDSGIIVPDVEDTSDLVPVHVVAPQPPAYDQVPPPRPTKITAPNNLDNDVPPEHFQGVSPQTYPSDNRISCPVDLSSCSESSLSSINTDSSSDLRARPSSNSNYDYPSQPNYDVPKLNASHYDTPKRSSSGSENGNELYDYPPQQTYDIVPPPVCVPYSSTLPIQRGLTKVLYQNSGQYSKTIQDIYDQVPSRFEDQPTYDVLPRPLSSGDTSGNYDYVPPPVPAHSDNVDGQEGLRVAPPLPRHATVQAKKTYVNLTFPSDDEEYKKPLPSTPHEMQQDSGTDHDVEEDVYDVPPVQPGYPAPSVDRTNKPGVLLAPRVDRRCKPEQYKVREYVNLPPTRSVTLRECSNYTPRKGGNVQRSKSAAADFENEGYLFMDSPKRTDSSLRYTKNDARKSSFVEDDENEAYQFMQRNGHDNSYENYDTPRQLLAKKESSPERTPLRGHYQDIDVVCQREAPSVPERSPRTQYTTIDVEKTRGFRKTCEDAGKGQ